MYRVAKHRIRVDEDSVIDGLEIFQGRSRKFYSFTYRMFRDEAWHPLVRWDNLELRSHIDRFDPDAALVEQVPFRSVTLSEVEDLVRMFGSGLVTMDITNL